MKETLWKLSFADFVFAQRFDSVQIIMEGTLYCGWRSSYDELARAAPTEMVLFLFLLG